MTTTTAFTPYTAAQISEASTRDLRSMKDALAAHIETMHGGIVRGPFLDNYWAIENEIRERFNAGWNKIK
jgi:hypothetical protein